MSQMSTTKKTTSIADNKYVTLYVDNQLFGIDVLVVRDVLRSQKITPIPLAPSFVIGALNLRGRIVTAIDIRAKLGIPHKVNTAKSMNIVVEYQNELYSLLVDRVGEVLNLSNDDFEQSPGNLDSRWKNASEGVYRLKNELMVVLDINQLLSAES